MVAQMVKHWVHWMIDHLVLLKGCTSVEMMAASMVGLMGHQMECQMAHMTDIHWVAMTAHWTAFQKVDCSVGLTVQQMERQTVDEWDDLWVQPTVGQMAALWAHLKVAQMVLWREHSMADHWVVRKESTSVEVTAASMDCWMVRMMIVHSVAMTDDGTALQKVECSAGQMVLMMEHQLVDHLDHLWVQPRVGQMAVQMVS